MTRIGYHCSHEQYAPGELLRLVKLAERAGFQAAMCSDHISPWGAAQGESGYAWSWLGAALEATGLSMGIVTPPGGWRYHPAVHAHAGATLATMYPGRFWMAAGSGEALNEHVVGQGWPEKDQRNERLESAVQVMRALWAGETVTRVEPIAVDEAKLYSLPTEPPAVLAAALTPETARWAGRWADGLITVTGDRESVRQILDAFREGGGEGKPLYLQAQLSFARSTEAAVEEAWDQWRTLLVPKPLLAELRTPAEFERAAASVTREDVRSRIRCSHEVERHTEWILADVELGFSAIYLHNVSRSGQERFIEQFGERVIPAIGGAARTEG